MSKIRPPTPDAIAVTPQWRRHLIEDLLPGPADHAPGRGLIADEVDVFGCAIAHAPVKVLVRHLLDGDLSLWAAARGDGERAAELRAIECDLIEHLHQQVEVARALVLEATRPEDDPRVPGSPARTSQNVDLC